MAERWKIGQILHAARRAKQLSGKPIVSQLADMIRVRRGPGKVFPSEYFAYRLYSPALDRAKLHEFVGLWARRKIYDVQDPQWLAVANDKLLSYMVLNSCGLPFPRVKAILDPFRTFPGADCLRSPDDAMAWLRTAENYPFFAKLCTGAHGTGACFAASFDAEADAIVSANGETIGIRDFATRMFNRCVGGVIFQEIIEQHPQIRSLLEKRVGTARIMTLADPAGVHLHRGVFRIPVGDNITDNFELGRSGNGFGAIDLETGRLTEVLNGVGFNYSTMERHPDTGRATADFVLPDWRETVDLIQRGHRAMPGLRIIGWDIAFTASGPTVVEINANSDYFISQSTLSGLATAKFRELFPLDDQARRARYPNIDMGT